MRSRLQFLLSFVALAACTSWLAAAEPAAKPAASSKSPGAKSAKPAEPTGPRAWKPKLTTKPSLVAVLPERGGRRTLYIRYYWKIHQDASVEVRLIPGEREKGTSAVPTYFVGEYRTRAIRDKVYRCLQRADEPGPVESFTKDKLEFQIIGRHNSLGRRAVFVLPFNEGGTPEERPGAVYLHLDSWALGDRELSLDLPPEVFTQSGMLFVWFFRGERNLWEEQVQFTVPETEKPKAAPAKE